MYKKHQEKQSKNWDKNSTSWDHPRSGEIFDIHAFSKQAAPWSFQRLCWTPDVRDLFKRPYRQALVKFSENGKCLFLLTTFLAIFRMDKLRIQVHGKCLGLFHLEDLSWSHMKWPYDSPTLSNSKDMTTLMLGKQNFMPHGCHMAGVFGCFTWTSTASPVNRCEWSVHWSTACTVMAIYQL
jgi:hypothetical protein